MSRDEIRKIAEESELTREDPYPAGTRGRRAQRGVVMSVRLSDQEHNDLLAVAESEEIPPSTLVRSLVQDYLVKGRAPRVRAESVGFSVVEGRFVRSLAASRRPRRVKA